MQGFVFTQNTSFPKFFYRESIERNGSPIRDLGDDVNYFFMQIEVIVEHSTDNCSYSRSSQKGE